jgi:hypothetical protein
MSMTDYIAKLDSAVSSSPAIVVLLQIAASARFGDLSSIAPFDPEADAALWSVLLMSTKGEARELVQQHGAIGGTTGVSSAVHAMHALSKACEDTSLASLANALKSVFLGSTIGLSKNPTLAVLSIEVEVRKLGEQFNVAVSPWLLFCTIFARIDRSVYAQIVENIGAEAAREFDEGMLSKLKSALQARWVALGSGKKVVQSVQVNYAAAGAQKLVQQKHQKRQENAHLDSFRPTIQGGPRTPKAAVPKDATCKTCNKSFVRTMAYANGSLMPFKTCWDCARAKKTADVSANLLIESMPEEAKHGGGENVPFYEQFVDMFTVTTEQQAVSHEDCLKVPPIDCSPGIEIYRASACVEALQRVPIDFSEDFPVILLPKMDKLDMMDKKYKRVQFDRLHDSLAAFANGGLSNVPDKSVATIDGVTGAPSATATTNAIEPGHSDFHPLASSGNSAIYGVTDKPTTPAGGAPGAEFETPVHATGTMESEHSGLSTQSHDGALEKFSTPDKSVEAAGEMPFAATTSTGAEFETPVHATGTMEPEHSGFSTQSHNGALEKFSVPDKSIEAAGEITFAAATSTGAIPPSSGGPGDPARPLTTAGISFRSVVGGAASRVPRSGN